MHNPDELWKHYAKWKKSVTKDHILYKMYCTCKLVQTEKRLIDCQAGGVGVGWGGVGSHS